MSDVIKDNVDTTITRRRYIAQISFSIPDSGSVGVFAESPEHAKELLPKILAHVKDLEIHDIVEENKVDLPKVATDTPPPADENTKVLN